MKISDLQMIERHLIRARRSTFRDFSRFRQYYFGHYHKVPDGTFHGDLAETLGRIGTARGSKVGLAAPRGSAKSTIITLEYVVYALCYRSEDFIVIISSTADHAAEYLANIKNELEGNDRLRKDFPEVCEIDKNPTPARWSQKEIITKNNIKVSALGVGQNIRGKRHNQHRPSLVILDDIEGNDMVQNDDSRYKLKDWFEKSVLKAGNSRTNFVFAGTIHHYGSLLAQYTDPQRSPGWESRIHRSVIKWSEALQQWQDWANIFRGNEDFDGRSGPEAARAFFEVHQERMSAGTEVLWPQSKSYYDLMVIREQEGTLSFDSEMQNEPVNPRDCFFDVESFSFWDDTFSSEADLIASLKHPTYFAACDPSLGKFKTRGDFSAIICAVKDGLDGRMYVLDVDMERRQPENLIETLLGYLKIRKTRRLAIESNHFQQMLVDELKKRAAARGMGVTICPVENRQDKVARIQTLEPSLKTGKLQLSRKHRALIDQLKYFPKGQHDDGPDALQMLLEVASQHVSWAAWV